MKVCKFSSVNISIQYFAPSNHLSYPRKLFPQVSILCHLVKFCNIASRYLNSNHRFVCPAAYSSTFSVVESLVHTCQLGQARQVVFRGVTSFLDLAQVRFNLGSSTRHILLLINTSHPSDEGTSRDTKNLVGERVQLGVSFLKKFF